MKRVIVFIGLLILFGVLIVGAIVAPAVVMSFAVMGILWLLWQVAEVLTARERGE